MIGACKVWRYKLVKKEFDQMDGETSYMRRNRQIGRICEPTSDIN